MGYLMEHGEEAASEHVCHSPCWETMIDTFDDLYKHDCSEMDPHEEMAPICEESNCHSPTAEACIDNWIKDGCPWIPEDDFLRICITDGECAEAAFHAGLCPDRAVEQRHEAETLARQGEAMC